MKQQKMTKATVSCVQNSKKVKVACLRLVFFVRVKYFCKKKLNSFEIVSIASITYTTHILANFPTPPPFGHCKCVKPKLIISELQ